MRDPRHGIPRLRGADQTIPFLRDPYRFISKQCARLGSDVFEARILLAPTICMKGREAAQVFYDDDKFVRAGAAPRRLQRTLLGTGGVQSLDDGAHRHRKHMLLSALTPDRVARLVESVESQWREQAWKWRAMGRFCLFREIREVLTVAVCRWAHVPLTMTSKAMRARQLGVMFTGAGRIGPLHWGARWARRAAESWIAEVIADIRNGAVYAPENTAAAIVARHREPDGTMLESRVAAVELLNILRPTVALSVYVTFIAVALHLHPAWRERVAKEGDDTVDMFVQEVRRFYPFFPSAIARVRRDFHWNGWTFRRGQRALLDLYGTGHDARIWDRPEEFDPERFARRPDDAFGFIPQGGGDQARHHRCAGEQVTIAIMKLAARLLAREARYTVPAQDLGIDFSRLPALPRSGFIMDAPGR
jgi:fatty-acid peroxygenase